MDIINEILEECILAYPDSSFVISLYKQYGERGSLSKKQLQGLHGKASKIMGLAPGKLATVEAIIKKMPTRYKSEIPVAKPLYEKDEKIGNMITKVLDKYPAHKRVIFFQSKFENNEIFSTAEIAELENFVKVVERKG